MQSCSFEIDANVSLNDAASKKLFIGSENNDCETRYVLQASLITS